MESGNTASGPVFTGEFQYAADKQRRVPLPAAWRRELGDAGSLMMVPREDMQVEIMTEALFHERMMPYASGLGIRQRARIGAMAHRSPIDKQGRVTISQKLLLMLRIEEQVLLVGALQSILLLNPSLWTMADESTESAMIGYAERERGGQFL